MTAATDRRSFHSRRVFRLHAHFRREVARGADLVRAVTPDDVERAQAVAARVRIVDDAVYRHQCAEDTLLWPRLVGDKPSEADIMVDVMVRQHRALDAMSLAVQAAVLAWEDEPTEHRRDMLADVLARFSNALGEHICATELFLVPLLERFLCAADWADVIRLGVADCDHETALQLAALLRQA
ncbi:hemerythrin domain-containing protein [Kutzneria sp. CA-103260]|uniref:hemerythrin domain-containing protein n=1 Tax=Kutzneria sp. CA-103260 TaxID=2802641 RepID=UPI001BAB74AB|nr:hemerythrin domain-containing protein [Kutzneria sp. CA-103260]QUQ66095.1 Hemerythrin HHE cation binding domain protein [Kutzneria sp. CA-103260]